MNLIFGRTALREKYPNTKFFLVRIFLKNYEKIAISYFFIHRRMTFNQGKVAHVHFLFCDSISVALTVPNIKLTRNPWVLKKKWPKVGITNKIYLEVWNLLGFFFKNPLFLNGFYSKSFANRFFFLATRKKHYFG